MADQTSRSAGIGLLLNNVAGVGGGLGTFPANAAFTPGGSKPNSVAVGNFIANPVPPPAPANTVDAAVANDNAVGGVHHHPQRRRWAISQGGNLPSRPRHLRSPSRAAMFNDAGVSIVAVNGGNAAGTSPSIDIIVAQRRRRQSSGDGQCSDPRD